MLRFGKSTKCRYAVSQGVRIQFRRLFWLPLWIALAVTVSTENLSAYESALNLTVIHSQTYIQRSNVNEWVELYEGSELQIYAGDRIITGELGRVYLTFSDEFEILLLPHSEIILEEFIVEEDGSLRLNATSIGVSVHRYAEELIFDSYDFYPLTSPPSFFSIMANEGGCGYATVAEGTGIIASWIYREETVIDAGYGVVTCMGRTEPVVELEDHLAYTYLIGQTIECTGSITSATVQLGKSPGREPITGPLLTEGDHVQIFEITDDHEWYRVQYQSAIGWVETGLINADCEHLRTTTYGVVERFRQVPNLQAFESDLLTPFFGAPEHDPWFYVEQEEISEGSTSD